MASATACGSANGIAVVPPSAGLIADVFVGTANPDLAWSVVALVKATRDCSGARKTQPPVSEKAYCGLTAIARISEAKTALSSAPNSTVSCSAGDSGNISPAGGKDLPIWFTALAAKAALFASLGAGGTAASENAVAKLSPEARSTLLDVFSPLLAAISPLFALASVFKPAESMALSSPIIVTRILGLGAG